jgi:PAS domain S-box-containing protein
VDKSVGWTANHKGLAAAAIFAAMLVVAAIDYAMPQVSLRPLAVVFVIAMAAVAGLRWSIAGALVAAPLFTLVDVSTRAANGVAENVANVGIMLLALGVAIGLVQLARQRAILAEVATRHLESARSDNERLRDRESAAQSQRLAERRYRELGESLPFGIWQLDASGSELVYVSESYCTMLGMSREQIAAGGWEERVPPEDRERFHTAWAARDPDRIFEGEYRVRGADGRLYWIMSRGVAMRDENNELSGWVGFALDVTSRRRSADQVTFLAELSRVLSLSLDPVTTLERTAQLMVPRVADWYAVDLIKDSGAVERMLMVHSDQRLTLRARALLKYAPSDLSFPEGAPHVIATGRPTTYDRLPPDIIARVGDDEQLRRLLEDLALRSAIVVPLEARDRTIGALTFISCDPERHYDSDDLLFAYLISRRVAIAYDNAQLYAREHQVADTLQRASLPETLPDVPNMSIRAHYVPGAREAEIGGDWYDAFQLPDGKLALSIGDVAGKGLQAAATMNTVRLALRAAAFEGLAPSAVLARANQLLLNDKPTMVTTVFGVLDAVAQRFTCSIAGHPMPVLVTADGDIVSPVPVSQPIGVFRESTFPEQVLEIGLGSLLILYTDGLIETDHDIAAGEARLREVGRLALARNEHNPARFIAETIITGSPSDDVAVLTVATSVDPMRTLDLALPALPSSGRLFRQALQRLYMAVGLDESSRSSMQVAAGEAIMNAIEHAYGVRGGLVRVRGAVQDGSLVIEVSDRGRWRAPRDDNRGRGLEMMSGLVGDVTIDRSQQGTTVRLATPMTRVSVDA